MEANKKPKKSGLIYMSLVFAYIAYIVLEDLQSSSSFIGGLLISIMLYLVIDLFADYEKRVKEWKKNQQPPTQQ